MQSDLTYLVLAGSSIRKVADADQPGVRIAVPSGDASGIYLSRILKRAELVRTETLAAAFDLVRTGRADESSVRAASTISLGSILRFPSTWDVVKTTRQGTARPSARPSTTLP
jgi:hypothetical protein